MLGKILLVTVCSLIFVYYAFESLADYLSYQTVSQQSLARQESQPMPQICISSPSLAQQRLLELGITSQEYEQEGVWTSSNNYSKLSEVQVKEIISPDLADILVKISVRSRIKDDSDRYKTEVFSSKEILKGTKVEILTLDYVDYYTTFCFEFSGTGSFPFGIEKVNLYLKQKSKVFVVSPGNFYTFERKRNQMTILPDLNYNYQVCSVWYCMVLHTIPCNTMQYDESPYPYTMR